MYVQCVTQHGTCVQSKGIKGNKYVISKEKILENSFLCGIINLLFLPT